MEQIKPPITLATLAQATTQEVYDQIAKHLRKQGKPARQDDDVGGCVYRLPNGLACAGGCLISDREMVEVLGHDLNSETWGRLIVRGLAPSVHRYLIEDLQKVHDRWTYPDDDLPAQFPGLSRAKLEKGLRDVAFRFQLEYYRD